MTPSYPDRLEIKPVRLAPYRKVVRVPGSKSMTNRALVLAALYPPPLSDAACGLAPDNRGHETQVCCVRGALQSEDTEVMIDSLRRLGFRVETDWQVEESWVRVYEASRERKRPECSTPLAAVTPVAYAPGSPQIYAPGSPIDLFVGNSGTSMRFLTAMVSLGRGRFRLDGVPRMRERPIEDLLSALRQLGVNAYSEKGNGCPPIVVEANGLAGGLVRIKGDVSSQFLSALLMAAPLADQPVTIAVDGPLVSEPYVKMTIAMMRRLGLPVETKPGPSFVVPRRAETNDVGRDVIHIEPDATAASYFAAAAAIAAGEITIVGLDRTSLQGDIQFFDVLERMGCQVDYGEGAITVRGSGDLKGIDVDMNDISDTVMTLAAVACFASGPTTIHNVAHIRHKETDRLAALATELRRIGAYVSEFSDALTITPGPLHGADVETYNDHRMAMSLALVGLRVPGIVIKNPACVAKTYPRFFEDLQRTTACDVA